MSYVSVFLNINHLPKLIKTDFIPLIHPQYSWIVHTHHSPKVICLSGGAAVHPLPRQQNF